MKKILSFICILLIAGGCEKDLEKTTPRLMPLTEAVYASGKLKAFNEYKVYATVSGLLKTKLKKENDKVLSGQVIAEIQSDVSDLKAENAEILVKLARKNASSESPILAELKSQIETAKIALDNDSLNYIRYRNLFRQNVGTKAEVERRELHYRTSKNNYNAIRKRYINTKNQLETEYKNALNQFEISDKTKQDYKIRSLIDGKIYAIYKEQGELVSPQEPIALIGDEKKFVIELYVDELDINKVKKDQHVLITLDTYENRFFDAQIARIYPLLDSKTQTFKVDASFTNPPESLYPGLTAEANIVIREKDKTLVIPKNYLLEGDSVYIGKNKKKKIKKGLENLEYVEVVDGLDQETAIYK